MRWTLFYFLSVIGAIYWQCATQATPAGGPKDEKAPEVIAEKSTPSGQTRFTERSFTITLDEWIKLEDPANQILVSPPLEKRPTIRLKGRSVIFTFHEEEILKENATYSVNFGESIRDITEGNILKNHSFVFATGDVIDSLEVEGKVIDAFTALPVENALIMFYENQTDSVPLKEKPYYATKSDKEGQFEIGNMKGGSYKVVAIVDVNLNYLFDPGAEKFGFLDTSYVLSGSGSSPIELKMADPVPRLDLERRDTSPYNQATLLFNRIPYELEISYELPDGSLLYDLQEKTLQVWYFSASRQNWPLYLNYGEGQIDTLTLNKDLPGEKTASLKKLTRLRNSGHPSHPFYLCFDRPVRSLDTAFMSLQIGRIEKRPVLYQVSILDSLPFCLRFEHLWMADSTYEIMMLPGSLSDWYGLTNDTIRELIPVGNNERFGNISLTVEGLDRNQRYLIELMIKDKPELVFLADSTTVYQQTIEKLKPATYELRVTEDRNRNGRWDGGDLLLKIPPERTAKKELEALRANWDVEVNYQWNEK